MKLVLIRLFTINHVIPCQGLDDYEPEEAEKGQEKRLSSYLKLHHLGGRKKRKKSICRPREHKCCAKRQPGELAGVFFLS